MPAPQVSIIVPNYNHARFLERRLQSIFAQTFQDFEVLYLDDASTDNSAEVFAPFASHPKVKTLLNDINSGSPFKQWNKGVQAARGEYCWIAEADDWAAPELLARLVEKLDQNPEVGIAHCQSWAVDENDVVLHSMIAHTNDLDATRWRNDFLNDGRDECRNFLCLKNTIPNASAVLFRRKIFLSAGGAQESMRGCADWMTWLKMLLQSDIAFVAAPLNFFRHHTRSVRSRTDLNALMAYERYWVADFLLSQIEISPAKRERLCDLLIDEWLDKATRWRAGAGARRRSRAIYRIARRVDPHLNQRLLRRGGALISRRGWGKIGARFAPPDASSSVDLETTAAPLP